MLVCTHGNVNDFCRNRKMVPVCKYDGDIEEYSGVCRILVTDRRITEHEYYSLKSRMLKKGVELISTRYEDSEVVARLIMENLEKKKHGGRCKFGFQNVCGEMKLTEKGRSVVKRIFELRDNGYSYHKIREDAGVRHLDGRMLAVSTIQIILENRGVYEEWMNI